MLADPSSIVPFQPPQWMDFEDMCPSVKLSMQDMAARRSVKVQAFSLVRGVYCVWTVCSAAGLSVRAGSRLSPCTILLVHGLGLPAVRLYFGIAIPPDALVWIWSKGSI